MAEIQADATYCQFDTSMQILLNNRFQKPVEMLGNADGGPVRVGGFHALARLASEYSDSFHIPVTQLFSAFVVNRTAEEAVECVGPTEDSETPGEGKEHERGSGDTAKEAEASD